MISKFNFLMGVVWLFAFTGARAQTSTIADASIQGTPYMDEAYVQGEIYYGNSKRIFPLRYNAFQDLMEYKQNGQPLVLDPNPTITKVHFGSTTFVVEKLESKGKTKYGFLALLDSGRVMLFSKRVIAFHAAKKGGALDGSDQPARFTRAPDVYYYKIGDGDLHEVESIKSMIASLPGRQAELMTFAKKEKVSPRKENTLIQLVQYYNSL